MKFCFFNPIPWPALSKRPDRWPFPSDEFDPKRCERLYSECIDQLVFAEECGFDWIGVGEDHMTAYGVVPNPLLILSVVAQRTKKVRLAVLGAPLPLLNPIRVAEELAMVDVLSGGRVVAGFIRGVPQNYAAYHVPPAESRGRFAEADALIRKAWTEPDIFAWKGEFYDFPTVSLWPRPVQQPHPTVLYSANSETSAVFAAERQALIGAIHLYSRDAMDAVGRSAEAYRARAAELGNTPAPEHLLVGFSTCIAETDAQAQDTLGPALDYQYNVLSGTYNAEKRRIAAQEPGYGFSPVEEHPPTLEERIERGMVLCGSPMTVIDQIHAARERVGLGVISMHMQVGNMPNDAVLNSMRWFNKGVSGAFDAGTGA